MLWIHKIGPRFVGEGRLTWDAFKDESKCVANTLRL